MPFNFERALDLLNGIDPLQEKKIGYLLKAYTIKEVAEKVGTKSW